MNKCVFGGTGRRPVERLTGRRPVPHEACGSQQAQRDLVLLLHARAVADDAGPAELALPLRLHVRVQVPPTDLAVLQLAGRGHPNPLLDALVRLVLGGHWSDTPCAGAEGEIASVLVPRGTVERTTPADSGRGSE